MPSAADAELRDGELLVRGWRDGDAESVGLTPASPEIGEFFGTLFEPLPSDPDPEAPWFAVVHEGRVVGRVWFVPHKRPLEVGYFLHPDVWGRGFATRALILVRDWMDQPLQLCTHPRNERSQRVAHRAGFRRDGVVERYARFKDGETTAFRFVYP